MPPAQKQKIAEYYDKTLPYYERFWHKDSYGLHYGFWDRNTKSVPEALLNENKFMAETLDLKPSAVVLDAGCGVGGSSIWLAENYGVKVTGITISGRQLQRARELTKEKGLVSRIDYELQDYLRTKFADNSFDIVWCQESVCHAEDKKDFLLEAYRVLKPGGKLILSDGFLRRSLKEDEQTTYKHFIDGLALPNIAEMKDFKRMMEEVGFKKIKTWDKTKAVAPSSKIMYSRVRRYFPLAKLLYRFGIISPVLFMNSQAGIAQYKLVKSGAAGYGVFYGEK